MAGRRQKGTRKGQMGRVLIPDRTRIDGRLRASRDLVRWRCELTDSLGGAGNLSVQEQSIVELICRERMILDLCDSWILQQGGLLINKRRKSLAPILSQRQVLVDSLSRHLLSLGLKRRLPAEPDLQTYIREFDAAKEAERANAAPESPQEKTDAD